MNDWNPNHYRFARQLQRPEAIEETRGHTGDWFVVVACVLIALLFLTGVLV